MTDRELLIVVGHAYSCPSCRERLLADPVRTLAGQRLSPQEHEAMARLKADSFSSASGLAAAVGATTAELYAIMDDPRCRLRHF